MHTRLAAAIFAFAPLMAFSPPLRPTEPAQQQSPKSWIPETDKADKTEPPVTLNPTPQKPAAYLHAPAGLMCVNQPDGGPVKASREFVEAYSQAGAALRSKRHEEALAFAERAAPYANDPRQWMAIEQMRILAFEALGDDANLIASLETSIVSTCASPAQRTELQEKLDNARRRLGAIPR